MSAAVDRSRRNVLAGLGGLAASAALPLSARAQANYPTRPVRFLLPYGPGGISDVTFRLVAQKLSERIGQQFVIDNRPGAGSIVAVKAMLGARPDGYTLLGAGNSMAISKSLFKALPYDPLNDLAPISTTAFFDMLLLTKAASPLNSVQDVLAAARARPGKLNLACVAPGSTQNLSAHLFKLVTGIEAEIVIYRTTPELTTGLIRGDVDLAFDYFAAFNSLIADKQLKVLASTGEQRTSYLPDVPTAKEVGLDDYVVTSWNGLSGPKALAPEVIAILHREVSAVLVLPEVRDRMREFGMEARPTAPAEMHAQLARDIDKWAAVIERAGIERQ